MDENSKEPPPSNNKNSPIQQVESGPLSTSQELKAHDVDLTITSPRRPLSDTTKSTINSPKQKSASWKDISNDKEWHTDGSDIQTSSSAQLTRKLRHSSQHLLPKVGSDDNDGDNSTTRHSSKDLQQPESSHMKGLKVSSAKMVAAIEAATLAATEATATTTTIAATNSTRYPMEHNSIEKSSDDLSVVDDLKTQVADLSATLVVEQKKTRQMSAWGSNMEQLIQNFKEIRDDVIDSVDILVEFEEVMLAFEHEKQQQAEVDHLMNLVAERLFEVEEARQQLKK